MPDAQSGEQEALKSRKETSQSDLGEPAQQGYTALDAAPIFSGGRLDGRGSAPVRATSIQRMQMTHGNRAVQRYLNRAAATDGVIEDTLSLHPYADSASVETDHPIPAPVQRQASSTPLPVQRILGLDDAVDWVKGKAEAVGETVSDTYDSVAENVSAGADWVGDKASAGAEWVGDNVSAGANWVGDKVNAGAEWVGEKASAGADWVGDKVSAGADWVGDKVSAGADWVQEKASAGADWVQDKASDAWNWTKGAASDAYDWTKDKAGAAYDWTKDKAGAAYDWASDKVGGAVDWVKDQFKEKPKTFDDLAKGGMDTADAPDKIKLPEVMNKGMGAAWDKSFPGGQSQEQGGILVQNADGSYEWKAGTAKTRAEGGSGAFSPNRGDVGKGQTLVGTGHTHPYDASEGGMTNVPFSGTDLANMIYNPEKMKMVQSGEGQFLSARTSEFDKKIKDLDDKGKKKMYDDMKKEFDTIMYDPKDKRPFEERNRDAAIAVSKKYGLLFYEGKGGELARQ